MPSTYAHYRLGQEIRKKVPEDIRECIEKNQQLFNIGLHGPDILFYYKPLKANEINGIGYGMHERPGEEFFKYAKKVIRKNNEKPAYLAYVYGFICHFALDVSCHAYIDEKINESGVSHAEIEVEFDRKLMIMDGLDPIRHKLTNHIIPSMENAVVIKHYYKGITAQQVRRALDGMIFNNNLLLAPSKLKRCFVYAILKLSGNYKEMHGLIVNYTRNPKCIDSTKKLLQLYDNASDLALHLIEGYLKYVHGDEKLNAIYEYTFGGKFIGE